MNEQQANLLNKLFEKRNEIFLERNFNLLIHSVLNTVTLPKLIDIYLTLPNNDLKASSESNILKRIPTHKSNAKLYAKLYTQLNGCDYSKKQRIRILLFALLPNLKKIHYEDFFETFYNSEYQNDIKYALKIYDKVANIKRDAILLKDYYESGKEMRLKALIQFGQTYFLALHVEKIWQQRPSGYLKNWLVKRLLPKHSDRLDFIEQIDPEHYLYILCNPGHKVKEERIVRCFGEIPDNKRHYAIYNLSRTGKWNIVEKEIINYMAQ